jgi:peptidoglycan/LPS O-acetylase OafA/YrhL
MPTQFRKDINGLRAIAVIAVVLFHFNAAWMPGGFAGVDVFFVISGFLMTGIIFRGIEQENFSILKFYVARANRIIPALALLCMVLLVFGWFYLTPLDYSALGKHVGSSMGFLSNFTYWLEAGYFDTASHGKWLLHTWSLSAEWQFYMIYPLVLVAMRKFMPVKVMKATVLIGTVLGFIFCVIVTYNWPDSSYYLLHTRAWEMMLGGVAYLYPIALKEERKKLLEWFGFALIIGSYFFISKENLWPGYLAIFPVLGSFMLIQAQRNDSFITSNIVAQKIGAWSYSIYLWHWPLVVAIYYFALNEMFIYIGIVLSVLLGFLSNKYIENIKFRNNFGDLLAYLKCKPIYMVFLIGLLGTYIFTMKGGNAWFSRQNIITQKTYSILIERSPQTGNWGVDTDGNQDFSDCRFSVNYLTVDIELRLKKCLSNYGEGVLILGDSHAKDLFGMVSSRFDNKFVVGIANTQGCRPHTLKNKCQYEYEKVKKFLSNNVIFNHVIYEQGGFYLLLDEQGNKGTRDMFSQLAISASVEAISVDVAHINRVISYLSELSEYLPVTWFGSRVEPHFTKRQILHKGCDFNFKLRTNHQEAFDSLDKYIGTNTAALNRVKFLSQNEVLNYQFPQDFMTCDSILWSDGDHLSIIGEELLGKRLPDSFLFY